MRNSLYIFTLLLLLMVGACKKYDLPPVKTPPPVSSYIKIDSIYKRYASYYLSPGQKTNWYKFSGDVNLECVVTADERSGNIYKTVYVEDGTGGLQVKLTNGGGLAVGDKIRINLNGAILDDYGYTVQLDSIDIEKRVVKLSSGNLVTPTKVTFNQLTTLDVFNHCPFQSRLVVIDSVQFAAGDKNKPFADAVGKYAMDRFLTNSQGSLISVRSSGYANFANNLTPCGKGSMTVIVTQYINDIQFTIRDFNEVKLASGGCPMLIADFETSDIFSGGWSNVRVSGSVDWKSGTYGGKRYAEISNYINSANQPCETWFISPSLNLNSATSPYFTFSSAYNFTGPTLEVYVSTNYVSGNPQAATWTLLNPTLSSGSFAWANSGVVSLSAYKSANTRIAFRYSGTSTDGSRWEIDDVAVFAE